MVTVLVIAGNKSQYKIHENAVKQKHKDAAIRYAGKARCIDGLKVDKIELVGQYWLSDTYRSDCYKMYESMLGEENISKEFA